MWFNESYENTYCSSSNSQMFIELNKVYGTMSAVMCSIWGSMGDSPCGQCWQRREAQWHLHLHCFSGPGTKQIQNVQFTLNIFSPQNDGTLQSKWSLLAGNYDWQLSTDLAQGTVGLLIEEFDLICSRAGLFVRKTPGHLREEVTCWQI